MKCYVYFVMAATEPPLYKIGIAKNLRRRLRCLQTSCPFDLAIFYKRRRLSRQLARDEERHLHALFREKRCRGEWFQLGHADLQRVMRSPGDQHEQAWKTVKAIPRRQARGAEISRSRRLNRALSIDVASIDDADLRDLGRAASNARTRAITERQKTSCPPAFVHVRKRQPYSCQQLELPYLN